MRPQFGLKPKNGDFLKKLAKIDFFSIFNDKITEVSQ